MGFLDLQERKVPWELLALDPEAKRARKVHLGVLGKMVLLVPVVLPAPLVLQDSQVVLVHLDHLDLLDIRGWRACALKEPKGTMDFLDKEDFKVRRAAEVPLVLQVLVLRETKG